MPPTLGAGARRASAAALRTTFSRQGAVRGRASWPRLRRHLADKIGLPCPKDDRGKVFIKFPLDVTRSSVELYPGNSGLFDFLKNRLRSGAARGLARIFCRLRSPGGGVCAAQAVFALAAIVTKVTDLCLTQAGIFITFAISPCGNYLCVLHS